MHRRLFGMAPVLAFLLPLGLGGCATVASPVGNGSIYTGVYGPVAVGPAETASKRGQSCAENYLGIIAVGDASIASAKRDGGITRVASVDHHSTSVLGIFSRYCTIVSGS